jgi:hypothetical protein
MNNIPIKKGLIRREGRIALEKVQGAIRLRWTQFGKTYSLTVGKATSDILTVAIAKAREIDSDITFERFDTSLVKYGKYLKKGSSNDNLTLCELWEKFLDNKFPFLKEKTKEEYLFLTKLLEKVDTVKNFDGLFIRKKLLEITTPYMTYKLLVRLNACCNWGIKNKLCTVDPFEGLGKELKASIPENITVRAFTDFEISEIFLIFHNIKITVITQILLNSGYLLVVDHQKL